MRAQGERARTGTGRRNRHREGQVRKDRHREDRHIERGLRDRTERQGYGQIS